MTTGHPLASEWDLDPACVYLNHGSFGPSPRAVREAREVWSRRLERQPMQHFCRDMEIELDRAGEVLAGLLHTQPDRLVLLDNATFAMNVVAASTPLKPGDEVLLTDHEYGAVRNIWQARCRATGARTASVALPFPPTPAETAAAISAALKPETKLLVVSHVTSATACVLPLREICQAARQRGVPVCVDGPHALAMLDLHLDSLGCDYYCGSGHKWLCGPFGSGFLWVHPRRRDAIQTPIVSWGGSIAGRPASWKDSLQWLGTRDAAPSLALADAVRFFTPDVLAEYRRWSHELISAARQRLLQIPDVTPFCTPADTDFVSMAAVELPQTAGWKPGYHGHPDSLQIQLRDRHGIEVLTGSWSGRRFLRLSAHLYNTPQQLELCTAAVAEILQQERRDS